MAEASHHRLLQLPRSPNQLGCAGSLSSRDHRTLAPDTQPTQSKRRSHLGSNGEAGGRLAPKAANPSYLAQPAFRRQAPEVRAVCIKVHVRIGAGGAGYLALLPRQRWRDLTQAIGKRVFGDQQTLHIWTGGVPQPT